MTDPFDDPQFAEWARNVRDDLVPKITASGMTVSLVPSTDVDVKFAVELGLSIMLDKPIIAVIDPGVKVPERLLRVADVIVEGPISDRDFHDRLHAAISQVIDAIGDHGSGG